MKIPVLMPVLSQNPSVFYAVIVIFIEFFAWGLLITPMISVIKTTFPQHPFLMNGIFQGIKGLLSFFSAPLIGAMSDTYGRRPFLILTVLITCLPIPFMTISPWLFFTLVSVSGLFSVTFSVIFAYVADITSDSERSTAYGLVSATFAASLVTSPTIGAYIEKAYSKSLVVVVATAAAIFDFFFIVLCVPESLNTLHHDKSHASKPFLPQASSSAGSKGINKTAVNAKANTKPPPKKFSPGNFNLSDFKMAFDPLSILKPICQDKTVLLLSISVFLSFLPEAGQMSSFFVYLKFVIGFSEQSVGAFIAFIGVLSVLSQTVILSYLIKSFGPKPTIMIGLVCEMLQLAWYGLTNTNWMIWCAGSLAALGTLTYPAVSAYISSHVDVDKQGLMQGVITGVRGLCNGIGPALFGFVFYLFNLKLQGDPGDSFHSKSFPNHDLRANSSIKDTVDGLVKNSSDFLSLSSSTYSSVLAYYAANLPGPPYMLGSIFVMFSLFITFLIPDDPKKSAIKSSCATPGKASSLFKKSKRLKQEDSQDSEQLLPLYSKTSHANRHPPTDDDDIINVDDEDEDERSDLLCVYDQK